MNCRHRRQMDLKDLLSRLLTTGPTEPHPVTFPVSPAANPLLLHPMMIRGTKAEAATKRVFVFIHGVRSVVDGLSLFDYAACCLCLSTQMTS